MTWTLLLHAVCPMYLQRPDHNLATHAAGKSAVTQTGIDVDFNAFWRGDDVLSWAKNEEIIPFCARMSENHGDQRAE